MLTAWDKTREATLALPDFESGSALQEVRARTRRGDLVCPTCHQLLWVHAGQVLIPHFAHRSLSDCPQGRVSEAVLGARRLLYRFFQVRIESGKLKAEIVLEPAIAGLPQNLRVDLLLRRADKPAVHVLLLERSLKPDIRAEIQNRLGGKGGVFRPVFLHSRLRRPEDEPKLLMLDTTQREFCQASPYDLLPPEHWLEAGTLHFVNAAAAEWTTLRGVSLVHDPQVFRARRMRVSRLEDLLWSEVHAEWVHPGEAEELSKFRKAIEAKRQRQAEERRRAEAALQAERQRQAEARRSAGRHRHTAARVTGTPAPPVLIKPLPAPEPARVETPLPPEPVIVPEPSEPLPTWISSGLVCVGCGQRTTKWQNAAPDKDQCVCKTCFATGVRLR